MRMNFSYSATITLPSPSNFLSSKLDNFEFFLILKHLNKIKIILMPYETFIGLTLDKRPTPEYPCVSPDSQ